MLKKFNSFIKHTLKELSNHKGNGSEMQLITAISLETFRQYRIDMITLWLKISVLEVHLTRTPEKQKKLYRYSCSVKHYVQ